MVPFADMSSPDNKSHWPNPEYHSPFFSFEMRSSALVKQRLEALAGKFGDNEHVGVRLGPPSEGIIGTPEVNVNTLNITDYAHELVVPINLPITSFDTFGFLDGRAGKFSPTARRTSSLQKDIKTYLGKDMKIEAANNYNSHHFYTYDHRMIPHMEAQVVVSSNKSYWYHYLSPTILAGNTPVSQIFFEKAVKDAMILSFIHADYLLSYLGINLPPTTVTIDPEQFQVIERRPISMVRFIEELRANKESIVSSSVVQGIPLESLMQPNTALNPEANNDRIMILSDGKILFPPDRRSAKI